MFSEQTRDRGVEYYLSGHVLEIRCAGTRVIGAVAGTQPRPYRVVIDTRRFESAVCSCPVGRACKHFVALVLALWNDEQTDSAIRDRVARFAGASGLPPGLHRREAGDGDFTIDLETRIRDAAKIRAAKAKKLETTSQAPRYTESDSEGTWRLALLINADIEGRPEVALVRQYRRRDGEYGRVEACRGQEPAYVPEASARKLANRPRVFGTRQCESFDRVDSTLQSYQSSPSDGGSRASARAEIALSRQSSPWAWKSPRDAGATRSRLDRGARSMRGSVTS